MQLRVLDEADSPQLEEFLATYRDSSMFLRANARRSGLVYRGETFQALYMGAFDGQALTGVVAHGWNGMILVQAPHNVEEIARAAVAASKRRVTGFSGPLNQVKRARTALELDAHPAALESDETLYALQLVDLVMPAMLTDGTVTCRPPTPDERDELCAWRLAYDIETLNSPDNEKTRQRSSQFLDAQIAAGHAWVAVQNGRLVSLSAFNAALPDIVQLGGIYTPPEYRGRGFARAAVAASLVAAADTGVTRAVLFTDNPHAVRSYEAVGFRRAGAYGLILLSQEVQ